MITTLNKIREHSPCAPGWAELLKHLGKHKADDEPLSIRLILNSNGLKDAIWCLRAVDGFDREIRLYAVWCARQVQHLMIDPRSIAALDVAERFANGDASKDEMNAARAAAWAAASEASWAAARAAAWAAASEASWAAARAAAWGASSWASQEKELRAICARTELAPARASAPLKLRLGPVFGSLHHL